MNQKIGVRVEVLNMIYENETTITSTGHPRCRLTLHKSGWDRYLCFISFGSFSLDFSVFMEVKFFAYNFKQLNFKKIKFQKYQKSYFQTVWLVLIMVHEFKLLVFQRYMFKSSV